jgi:hypothetical protein
LEVTPLERMLALLAHEGDLFFPHSTRSAFSLQHYRYAHQASYQVSHICYQADGVLDAIVYLGTSSDNQACYPVRLIQFWLHGRHYRYLTNVLDPHVLKLSDVVGLYARRWDIELAFRAIKDHLNLHHLWSAKWPVVQVQLWCCLILAQVYHAL